MTAPLLVATVGSDHHPFDRLVGWIDDYLVAADRPDLRYFCQHATAHEPRTGDHRAFVDHDVLLGLLGEASAIVSHGGPGTLLESLRRGRIPLAVPRLQRFGEAVDDHQLAFCELLAERREVVLALTEAEFHHALDRMLSDPAAFRAPPLTWDDREPTLERFATLVAECRPARRGRLLTSFRSRRTARQPAVVSGG